MARRTPHVDNESDKNSDKSGFGSYYTRGFKQYQEIDGKVLTRGKLEQIQKSKPNAHHLLENTGLLSGQKRSRNEVSDTCSNISRRMQSTSAFTFLGVGGNKRQKKKGVTQEMVDHQRKKIKI